MADVFLPATDNLPHIPLGTRARDGLPINITSYASDLIEDALVLAQIKAMNSFSFRDLINTLTEIWGYCYDRICTIDPGYYTKTIQLRDKLTRLPPDCRNVVNVYNSRAQVGFSRRVYKQAGQNDMTAAECYHISGRDLYCWDADLRVIFVEYIPVPVFLTFTRNNRDPKVLWRPGDNDANKPVKAVFTPTLDHDNNGVYRRALPSEYDASGRYGMWQLIGNPFMPFAYTDHFQHSGVDHTNDDINYATENNGRLYFRNLRSGEQTVATWLLKRDDYELTFLKFDHPYTFASFRNIYTGEYESYVDKTILRDAMKEILWSDRYNPFDFIGRGSNVEFYDAKFNDYTGMGVTILDHSDGTFKQLGFTPDTLLVYPTRVMYNWMVATMAKRLSLLNGSTVMAVEQALVQTEDQMGRWLKVNKSAWSRAVNVTGPTLSDWL